MPTRKITGINGITRWACSACGLSFDDSYLAAHCCPGKAEASSALTPEPPRKAPLLHIGEAPSWHRTHDQIVAELEARMAELEYEYRLPAFTHPCKTCRWRVRHECSHPLVTGFGTPLPNMDWQIETLGHVWSEKKVCSNWPTVGLCGFERALWEASPSTPKPPPPPPGFWKRLLDRLFG